MDMTHHCLKIKNKKLQGDNLKRLFLASRQLGGKKSSTTLSALSAERKKASLPLKRICMVDWGINCSLLITRGDTGQL
jgi:hypothetical protein